MPALAFLSGVVAVWPSPVRCLTSRAPTMVDAAGGPSLPPLPRSTVTRSKAAIRDFVTQRAVQQAMFTSLMLRGETNAGYLDRFCGGGMEDAHVCDALRDAEGARVGSDEFLRALLRAPEEVVLVKKPFAGRGGSTATNPYIKKRYFEYEVDIKPRLLGKRVLEARKGIAEELEHDLKVVERESGRLWTAFRKAVDDGADVEIKAKAEDAANLSLVDKLSYAGVEGGGSPYREANFDLALCLGLYMAVELNEGGDWFRKFCEGRAERLLRPERGIRRAADGFLAALLSQSPLLKESGIASDPMGICGELLGRRVQICDVWMETLKTVPEEQLDLEREILEESL